MIKTIKIPKRMLSSIIYIQAAVLQATGIKVSHDQLFMLLLEEQLITHGNIRSLEVPDLNRYGQSYTPTEKMYDRENIPVDIIVSKWPELALEPL